MQLVEIDALQTKPLQATLNGLPEVGRARVMTPISRPGPYPSSFSRNDHTLRIRCQRLRNQLLADVRSIRICSVNKIDTQLDCLPQHSERARAILGRTPNSIASNPHRSKSDAVHRKFAAK